MKRIITLSTIPPRFPYLAPTLESLLHQKNVDEVRLYIPKSYKRFPNYKGGLPSVPDGIKICVVDQDLGPATKILPAVRDFKGQDVQILFCDDDLIYHQNWAKKLFDIQKKRSNEAVATYGRRLESRTTYIQKTPAAKQIDVQWDIPYRIQRLVAKIFKMQEPLWKPIIRAGYVDVLFGVGGVVVKPEFFDKEAFNIPEEVFAVDDIWLSAQLAKNNIPIYCPRRLPFARASSQSSVDSLLESDFLGFSRQETNKRAAEYCKNKYGIWKK